MLSAFLSHSNDIRNDMNLASFSIGIYVSISIHSNTDMYYCWCEYSTKTDIISNVDDRDNICLNLNSNVGSSTSLNVNCNINMNTEY